ncbi:hypothetical protein OAQ28_06535, partial [Planktomarina temperata]|nr:hypothetical protein [Planktomarina temperata]
MPFRQTNSLGQFLDSGELTGIHAPPPAPSPPNRAKDMRVLRLVIAWEIVRGLYQNNLACPPGGTV